VSRIVAGTAGGRTLRVPSRGTRPTSERVREALFSRLEHAGAVTGAAVLDLYAGSGALGLEAASRGARRVVLVEAGREAARTCRENARSLGLPHVEVIASRVESFLAGAPDERFDLALLDPPYDVGDHALEGVLAALDERWLAPGASLVVERSRRSGPPRWPAGLQPGGERAYGDTALWFATVSPVRNA
jgi:16S rRNA (guanine966-N2)-methyltransferase